MKTLLRICLFLIDNKLMHYLYKKNNALNAKMYEYKGLLRSIYYKALLGSCGNNLHIYGKPIIFHPSKIFVGDNFTINNNVQISPRGNIYIGKNVTMSRGSQITAGTLNTANWVDEHEKGNWIEREHIAKDVHIGDGTWLCVNSIVLPGVSITGKGVIVSAGAVVTKDITEDFVVVGGVPARIVKKLKP